MIYIHFLEIIIKFKKKNAFHEHQNDIAIKIITGVNLWKKGWYSTPIALKYGHVFVGIGGKCFEFYLICFKSLFYS